MGEGENKGIVYMNGVPFDITNMPEFTVDKNFESKCNIQFSQNRSISMTVTPVYPKMSRKRFVGSLKKRGYSKKDAKRLALYCRNKKIPYGRADTLISLGVSIV